MIACLLDVCSLPSGACSGPVLIQDTVSTRGLLSMHGDSTACAFPKLERRVRQKRGHVAPLDACLNGSVGRHIALERRVVREQARTYGRLRRGKPADPGTDEAGTDVPSHGKRDHEEGIDGASGAAGEILVGTAEPDPEMISGDESASEEKAPKASVSNAPLIESVVSVSGMQDANIHDVRRSVARCHDRMCVLTHQLLTLGPHRISEFKAAKAVRDDLARLRERLY